MKIEHHTFNSRAEVFLADCIGRRLAQYQNPTDEWAEIDRGLSPDGKGSIAKSAGSDEERSLISIGVIHETAQLKLRADRIENFISRRCKGAGPLLSTFADLLELEDLTELSKLAADIGKYASEPIMFAMQGKIATAVLAVPPGGCGVGGLDAYSRHTILDVIAEIAKYHLLISLIRSGEAAYRRCFEPTGMHVMDEHGGRRATTVKNVARVISWNAIWMEPLIGLYEELKTRCLTGEDVDAINAVPGLVEDAKRWESMLTEMFGDSTPAFVAECNRVARYWSRFIRRATVRKAAAADPNQTIYAAHGTHPLATLWLACVVATMWLKKDGADRTLLEQTLLDIPTGRSLRQPRIPKKSEADTRKLFFLVRNAVARDPKAPAVIASRKDGDLFAAIERKWQRELMKKTGEEPFSTTITVQANKLYHDAVERDDKVFLGEINGIFWRQLHL